MRKGGGGGPSKEVVETLRREEVIQLGKASQYLSNLASFMPAEEGKSLANLISLLPFQKTDTTLLQT